MREKHQTEVNRDQEMMLGLLQNYKKDFRKKFSWFILILVRTEARGSFFSEIFVHGRDDADRGKQLPGNAERGSAGLLVNNSVRTIIPEGVLVVRDVKVVVVVGSLHRWHGPSRVRRNGPVDARRPTLIHRFYLKTPMEPIGRARSRKTIQTAAMCFEKLHIIMCFEKPYATCFEKQIQKEVSNTDVVVCIGVPHLFFSVFTYGT